MVQIVHLWADIYIL